MLELLRQGLDPRPPALDVLFYTQKNEPTLVVAHVSRRAADAGLRTGDQILAVDGVELEPADLAELTHRLRGVDSPVALRVKVIRLSGNARWFTRDLRAELPLVHAKWVALAPTTKMGLSG